VLIRKQKTIPEKLSVAGLTDVHVGSKLFLEKEFNTFLEWINGKCPEKEKEMVGRIKYLLITGDNVDGIGVYPGQEKELQIKNIYDQYDEFCRLVKQIPDYIEVIITPGNHDAVRRADPQPALRDDMIKDLKGYKNIHFTGSPGMAEIEGIKFLLYHGASLHDLISSVGFLDHVHPERAMLELLKKRNLMPMYGKSNPYVPERKDYSIIKDLPDYIFFGDGHHNGYAHYRGTTIINSGTWQARTAFQVKLGHVPTPGVLPIVELDTGNIIEKRFFEGE
jgi:DNA polymerase II small subunit